MMKLDLLDINERGDKDFETLSEVEKNLYVLLLFDTLHEMEGITHFFSHHLDHLPRVLSFLAAIEAPNSCAIRELSEFFNARSGSAWNADSLDEFFCNMSGEDVAKIDAWVADYYSKKQEMWSRAKEYVRQQHGVEFT